ncbi:MAG: glycosyltransferase family 4 protein [Chlorobium sp.]|nr:glycosyltransferase family 4 protein [Chlorobium sp.]
MKILFIIDELGSGGAQRQMVVLACAMKDKGYDVEFSVYYPDDHYMQVLVQKNIPVHLTAKDNKFSLKPIFALRKRIVSSGFDVVIAFLETPCVYAELATIALRNIKLIVSERNTVIGDKVTLARWLKSYLHLRADVIVSNSYSQAKWLTTHFSFLQSKVVTVWNGVDLQLFHPVEEKSRRIDPGGGDTLSLLVVARVTREKNAMGLVKALGLCRGVKGVNVIVDWVGAFIDSDYMKQTEKLIQEELNLSDFSFLGPRKDVHELMRRYDALVLPSFHEGLPNAVCEALASGLPVLASNVCDNHVLIQDGETGLLFDPDNPESIADAIEKFSMLTMEEKRTMSLNARKFAVENLSVDVMAQRYESFLQHAI